MPNVQVGSPESRDSFGRKPCKALSLKLGSAQGGSTNRGSHYGPQVAIILTSGMLSRGLDFLGSPQMNE